MNFLKKTISTSIAFVLALSSGCCVIGYTSGELKNLASRLLCANYSYFHHLNPMSYRCAIEYSDMFVNHDKHKTLYDKTLAALDNFEEKYEHNLTDENFVDYYREVRTIWCKISDIIYRCQKYAHDISPHYFWQEYIFSYPSKLDNILSDMSMQKLQANDVKLDLLKNLSDAVWQDWVNEFDESFFKAAWEKGAIQEWVWYLCKREDEKMMDDIKDMNYNEAIEYCNEHYGNVYWVDIFVNVIKILAFQYESIQ